MLSYLNEKVNVQIVIDILENILLEHIQRNRVGNDLKSLIHEISVIFARQDCIANITLIGFRSFINVCHVKENTPMIFVIQSYKFLRSLEL